MRDKITLIRALRPAGALVLVALVAIRVLDRLVPAAMTVAMALRVSAVTGTDPAGWVAATSLPLAAFATALLVGYAAEAATEPLNYVASMRIDGAHRAAVARLAASSPTIAELEQPRVQRLVRLAKADPENWSERTPGLAAVAQLDEFTTWLGIAASAAILARFAWWLVPLFLLPALYNAHLRDRQARRFTGMWRVGLGENLRADRWQDVLLGAGTGKDVRIFGLGEWIVQRIRRSHVTRSTPVWAVTKRNIQHEWQQLALIAGPMVVGFGIIAGRTVRQHGSVGVETAAMTAAVGLFGALQYNDNLRDRVSGLEMLAAYAQLRGILGAPERPSPPTPTGAPAWPETASVPSGLDVPAGLSRGGQPPDGRFEDVSFAYPGTDRMILNGLNLRIRPGELLAIVGLNGTGKSTLIKLLAGLYLPTSGRITADGTDLNDLGVTAWRDRLTVVFQDFVKYHLSAADNVSLGHAARPADRAAVEAAARDSGFTSVLERLPDGWETPLTRSRTGGVDLSGGQWQQVVLTRALYAVQAGARLLVLDEPTAHLDVRTEFEVFNRLAARSGGASVVLISHRLSTVRQADRIVLLDGGQITESGTHDQLMAVDGKYARLFRIQAQRFQQGFDDHVEEGELR